LNQHQGKEKDIEGLFMTTLGKYELLETLGSGAYATVYRAQNTQLGRLVALKLLHPAHLLDQVALERFRREG
jgi:serine/threonine protein kinase